ncbi:unnamed protein product [Hyaloperonospora brassicae]|uniref:Uncharacterized protein n=1 Tax=Hyaloperonospora brassicae TaxID=162125 RepID=A0AAV0TRP6_HYABA|nr:unnamed protein product [Hyaloperonospora brassicae]
MGRRPRSGGENEDNKSLGGDDEGKDEEWGGSKNNDKNDEGDEKKDEGDEKKDEGDEKKDEGDEKKDKEDNKKDEEDDKEDEKDGKKDDKDGKKDEKDDGKDEEDNQESVLQEEIAGEAASWGGTGDGFSLEDGTDHFSKDSPPASASKCNVRRRRN